MKTQTPTKANTPNKALLSCIHALQAEQNRLELLHSIDPKAGYADRANAMFEACCLLKKYANTSTPTPPKNLLNSILKKLSYLTALESLVLGFILGLFAYSLAFVFGGAI